MKKKISVTQFDLSRLVLRNLNEFDLSPTGKLVLIAIMDKYPKIYPAQQTLSDTLGIGLSSVKRALKELREQGLLSAEYRANCPSLNYNFTPAFFQKIKANSRNKNKNNSAWREAVLKRDKYTCQLCGEYGKELHAHHKKSYSNCPESRYDVSNGITLCKDCHQNIHPFMKAN